MKRKFYKLIYVVVGIALILCAAKVYYDGSIKNIEKGYYVVEGSYVDTYLKSTNPADIHYIENKEALQSEEKFDYTILKDGTLSLDEYKGENKNLVIPEEIDGKKVAILNFDGSFRKITIPEGVKAITGNIEVTNKMEPSQLTVLVIFAVSLLIYITIIMAATKDFNLKVEFLSLMYLLIPIIYTLCTNKFNVISGKYDYTYLSLMTVTTIVYIIIAAIIVGYSKDKEESVKKTATTKKTTTKKTTTTTKKAPAKKKTTKKK